MAKTRARSVDKALKYDEKTVKKIGSVPMGYGENAVVFIEDGKIFIAKRATR